MRLQRLFEHQVRPLQVQPTGASPKGRLTPPLRAILFDVYGTLLISGSGDIQASGRPSAHTVAQLQGLLRRCPRK